MKIFGDLIDDKLFPKKIKRFTSDEYVIIENYFARRNSNKNKIN